jgi:hypothetical protein
MCHTGASTHPAAAAQGQKDPSGYALGRTHVDSALHNPGGINDDEHATMLTMLGGYSRSISGWKLLTLPPIFVQH